MKGTRHMDALLAFEKNEDQLYQTQHTLECFQRRHKEKEKTNSDHFHWIQKERRLKHAEHAVTKQIIQSISRVLDHFQKEKQDESRYQPEDLVDEAINSFQGQIESLQQSSCKVYHKDDDIMSITMEVKKSVNELHEIHLSENQEKRLQEQNALCAQLLLDWKEILASLEEELDTKYAALSLDNQEFKRKAMKFLQDDCTKNNVIGILPDIIVSALEHIRMVEIKSNEVNGEDSDDVEQLEIELKKAFTSAKEKYDLEMAREQTQVDLNSIHSVWDEKSDTIFKSIWLANKEKQFTSSIPRQHQLIQQLKLALQSKSEKDIISYIKVNENKQRDQSRKKSAIQDFRRKFQEIESKGLIDIESLKKELEDQSDRIKATALSQLKRNELRIRLQIQRQEREKVQKNDALIFFHERMKAVDAEKENEIQLIERKLEAKQKIWIHRAEEFQKLDMIQTSKVEEDLRKETSRLSSHHTNKQRAARRELVRQNKMISKKNLEKEVLQAEERRLERLSALAISVPYYKTLINTTSNIHKTTEARKNDVYQLQNELADFQYGLQKLKSFTNEKVFSDSKFRLGNALHKAGVAHSDYARDVIRNAIPRVEERTTGIRPY